MKKKYATTPAEMLPPAASSFTVGDQVTFHHEMFGDVAAEVVDIRVDYIRIRPAKESGLSEHWLPATDLKAK